MRGVLITFEGCDGSGKSTQMKRVSEALKARRLDVLVTREPGGTEFGEAVRRMLLDPSGPSRGALAEAFLYSACRAELVQTVILPALKAGRIVLTERFVDSTIAYQGYGGGIPIRDLENMNEIATGGLVPDLTLVLDIDDATVVSQRLSPKAKDRIELRDDEYHARVRQGYRELAARFPERVRVVDGNKDEDQVSEAIICEVLKAIELQQGGDAS